MAIVNWRKKTKKRGKQRPPGFFKQFGVTGTFPAKEFGRCLAHSFYSEITDPLHSLSHICIQPSSPQSPDFYESVLRSAGIPIKHACTMDGISGFLIRDGDMSLAASVLIQAGARVTYYDGAQGRYTTTGGEAPHG